VLTRLLAAVASSAGALALVDHFPCLSAVLATTAASLAVKKRWTPPVATIASLALLHSRIPHFYIASPASAFWIAVIAVASLLAGYGVAKVD